ncbi:TOBE domain-containing protein [Luteibacter aegosomatissinici]|uniref:TOBE domain-containing protein n=1 Tax=Luteibacter aegosomatissinici TaxID=2911539 RepID=UPI001FF734FD|nr:TOBE domain-containing protein [Luteibacter aegosomatissinici]UPG96542.1 TOBE domain-containing protein [Luteibacter aegosomatissinici]
MLRYEGSLWLTDGARRWGGPDRVELLFQIARTGSITAAAKAVGMSYKGAWDAVEAMNQLAGEPLVLRATGGKGGGGATLTPRAERLIVSFRSIESAHRQFVEHLASLGDEATQDIHLLRHLTMRTSARNQLAGVVDRVQQGAVNDSITIRTTGGAALVATVTRESTDHLALAPGRPVIALIKASWIILGLPGEGRLSASNQLPGTVARIHPGAVNTEVSIDIEGGGTVTSIITKDSAESLGLVEGMAVLAIFDAASVIVGVTD